MIQFNLGNARRHVMKGACMLQNHEWAVLVKQLGLSPRETQILRGVFDDLKDCAIAERLGLSVHTVRTHFERLYRKLGVSSRSGLVLRVVQECHVEVRPDLDGDEEPPHTEINITRNGVKTVSDCTDSAITDSAITDSAITDSANTDRQNPAPGARGHFAKFFLI